VKKAQKKTAFARKLRREQTDAEKVLWAKLRNSQLEGVKLRRQQSIGPYVVDFVSLGRKLILEIDGAHHSKGETRRRDNKRTARLRRDGYRILRFWDNEVLLNIDGVLENVRQALG